MDINLIKTAYPAPVAWSDSVNDRQECYCIGGAVCLFYQIDWLHGDLVRFPCRDSLAIALREINPHLTEELAEFYAYKITHTNDLEEFGTAWDYADDAVNYTPEER